MESHQIRHASAGPSGKTILLMLHWELFCLLAADSVLKCVEEAITVTVLQIRIDERVLALLLFFLFDPRIVLAYLKG